jgi:hypothetical protein
MLQGNELKFQCGATANTERKQRNEGGRNCDHAGDGMAMPRNCLDFVDLSDFWVLRKIATDCQAPRIYPRMIPPCSRFDSVLFTPTISTIASYSNYFEFPFEQV